MDQNIVCTSIKDWETAIIIRAWKDPSYKKLLHSSREKALKQIGCPLNAHSMTFDIPHSPVETKNLAEEQLFSPLDASSFYCRPCPMGNVFTNG